MTTLFDLFIGRFFRKRSKIIKYKYTKCGYITGRSIVHGSLVFFDKDCYHISPFVDFLFFWHIPNCCAFSCNLEVYEGKIHKISNVQQLKFREF